MNWLEAVQEYGVGAGHELLRRAAEHRLLVDHSVLNFMREAAVAGKLHREHRDLQLKVERDWKIKVGEVLRVCVEEYDQSIRGFLGS